MENMIPILNHFPVGFRFHPTDEELVNDYLIRKLRNEDDPCVQIIPVIDPCKVEPWEIKEISLIKSDDPEWFFFSPVVYKNSNSKMIKRRTKCGFWKITGNDRKIKTRGTDNVIGHKRSLVFHQSPVLDGVKFNWVIHEYHAVTSHESQGTFFLCRLMKKAEKNKKGGIEAPIFNERLPHRSVVSDDENWRTAEGIPPVEDFIGPFQAPFSPTSSLIDAYIRNEDPYMQTLTDEYPDYAVPLWNFYDGLVVSDGRYRLVNNSTQPKSLRRVYNESSDTVTEVVSNLGRKELLPVKSEEDQKNAQSATSRENFETRSHQSSDVNRKGSFIYMETTSSCQNLFPRSVYLGNVVIGILLLIVISWEVLSC